MVIRSLTEMSDAELAAVGLLTLNLVAARDLPCARPWSDFECRRVFGEWVNAVRRGTENCFRTHRHLPKYGDLSDAQFRMLVLSMVLRRNLGVWYNLAFMDDPYDARDSCNMFLHGILAGRGGSCVSMPVMFAAIGRRLGYPIRLAQAKYHTFCRWDDPSTGERFNIEATAPGFLIDPDSHYMSWPNPIHPEEVDKYRSFLQNLTPREEYALFLEQAGMCWFHNLEIDKAVHCFYWAHRLHPNCPAHHIMWGVSLIVHRLFGPRPTDIDALDSDEITRRADSLGEFAPNIIRQARSEFQDVVTNWRTGRPPFREPRLNRPADVQPYSHA